MTPPGPDPEPPPAPGVPEAPAPGALVGGTALPGALVGGPALPEQSREDTDAAWGEYPERDDDRLNRDRPPHWDDA
jgi:hypothetical protein